ncbi:TPA: hypothetical protein RNS66_000428 [Stenotrophomonas maltophilia]|nr:hypothetical protein [Stenotrophomonas maltophilia]HDX0938465.1 hypothetical protein [Stenotrophomonas maltophilia]
MISKTDHTGANTEVSGTGPEAKAITSDGLCGFDPGDAKGCSATLTMRITHNQVIFTAQLDMGGHRTAQRVLERRRGNASGWVLTNGSEAFEVEGEWISAELAALADRLPFPFAVANMLPSAKASHSAVAAAAQEVAHG